MAVVIKIQRNELAAIFDMLTEVEKASTDMTPAWEELRWKWQQRVDDQFQRSRWKKLSPKYAKVVGRTQATLDTSQGTAPKGLKHRPGQMRDLIRKPEVFESKPQSLLMGVKAGEGRSSAFYAYFHQLGRGVPRRTIWKRLPKVERRDWVDVVHDRLLAPVRSRP